MKDGSMGHQHLFFRQTKPSRHRFRPHLGPRSSSAARHEASTDGLSRPAHARGMCTAAQHHRPHGAALRGLAQAAYRGARRDCVGLGSARHPECPAAAGCPRPRSQPMASLHAVPRAIAAPRCRAAPTPASPCSEHSLKAAPCLFMHSAQADRCAPAVAAPWRAGTFCGVRQHRAKPTGNGHAGAHVCFSSSNGSI
eukprot:scaffold1042_cov401-Prasinococcus_capsulatus_cf.AAC.17